MDGPRYHTSIYDTSGGWRFNDKNRTATFLQSIIQRALHTYFRVVGWCNVRNTFWFVSIWLSTLKQNDNPHNYKINAFKWIKIIPCGENAMTSFEGRVYVSSLSEVEAWCPTGDKPLREPIKIKCPYKKYVLQISKSSSPIWRHEIWLLPIEWSRDDKWRILLQTEGYTYMYG